MSKRTRKLTLNRETVRVLQPDEAALVAGGGRMRVDGFNQARGAGARRPGGAGAMGPEAQFMPPACPSSTTGYGVAVLAEDFGEVTVLPNNSVWC